MQRLLKAAKLKVSFAYESVAAYELYNACRPHQSQIRSTADMVYFNALPPMPGHAQPSAREDADGVRVMAATRWGVGVDGRGPGAGMTRVIGQAGMALRSLWLQAQRKATDLDVPEA